MRIFFVNLVMKFKKKSSRWGYYGFLNVESEFQKKH